MSGPPSSALSIAAGQTIRPGHCIVGVDDAGVVEIGGAGLRRPGGDHRTRVLRTRSVPMTSDGLQRVPPWKQFVPAYEGQGYATEVARGGVLTADYADGRGSEFWLHRGFMVHGSKACSSDIGTPHALASDQNRHWLAPLAARGDNLTDGIWSYPPPCPRRLTPARRLPWHTGGSCSGAPSTPTLKQMESVG